MEKYIGLLKLTGFFDDFSNEELIKLFTKNPWEIKTYEKDSFIHFEGEKCISWDIILSGQVIIKKIDEKGNILTLTKFGTAETIGGNTLFSSHPFFPMSVFAKSNSEILHIDKDSVLKLCHTSERFLLRFLTGNSDKAVVLSNKIKSISMKTIRESIIDFINYEYYAQESMKIQLPSSKRELAERFGIQRTSLSRELKKMKVDGLIDYNVHSITVLDLRIIKKL
jgi:CRP-like cAMP-binding protein